MLYLHHLAILRSHEGGSLVTVAVFGAVLASLVLYEFTSHHALGVHGHKCLESVATMYVQSLCHRAQSVSGIYVTTVLLVVLHAPSQLVGVATIGVLPICLPEGHQVVDVGTLCADDFSEHSLLCHVQSIQFIPVIAAVLQYHAMLTCLLREVDQLPALLQIHGAGHLYGCVLPILHGTYSHGEVVVPVGGHIHQVDVRTLAQFLISLLSAVDVGRWKSGITQIFLTCLCPCLYIVTQGHNLYSGDMTEASHGSWSTHAKSHESYPYGGHLGSRQSQYVLLSCGSLWGFCYDGSLVPMPLDVGAQTLCTCCQTVGGNHQGRQCNSLKMFLHVSP